MSFFKPEEYVRSVLDIQPDLLVSAGFRAVVLDLDNTLLPRDSREIPEELAAWARSLVEAGLQVCLLSNEWHRSVFDYARQLDMPLIYKAMKPWPTAFRLARSRVGGTHRDSIHIGDQMVTDVWGAHLAGMKVILVDPLSDKDLPHSMFLRKVEHPFRKGLEPTDHLVGLKGVR